MHDLFVYIISKKNICFHNLSTMQFKYKLLHLWNAFFGLISPAYVHQSFYEKFALFTIQSILNG